MYKLVQIAVTEQVCSVLKRDADRGDDCGRCRFLTSILTMSVMTSLSSCCLLQNVQRHHVFYEDKLRLGAKYSIWS